MGFFRQEYWSGLPFPSPGDLPDLGIEPASLKSPVLAEGFFTTSATWEALSCALMASKPHLLHCHLHLCCCCSVNKSCLTLPPYKLQHARLLCPSLSLFFFIFLNFILFLNFTILYWFCQISKWIHHRYTCVPHPETSSLLPPHTIPLGHSSAPGPSIQYRASNLDWRLISYMIFYMFQCHSPKSSHPLPLSQSP